MYLILIILIILIFFTEVRFKIINIIDDTDVYIKVGVINIHIDYDMFIKGLNKIKEETRFTYNDFKKTVGYYNVIKNIVNKSEVQINKLNIVKKNNDYNIFSIYKNAVYYSIFNVLESYLISNTKKQNNLSFYIIPSSKDDIDLEIDFQFSLILFLKSTIFNIKNIIKIKKDMI
ncbi:MAG: hypothetical protein R3Y05_05245 [bacterium]